MTQTFTWNGTAWEPMVKPPERPVYWGVTVAETETGKVHTTRVTIFKHLTAVSATNELYGVGGMTENMKAYGMTHRIADRRNLSRRIPT